MYRYRYSVSTRDFKGLNGVGAGVEGREEREEREEKMSAMTARNSPILSMVVCFYMTVSVGTTLMNKMSFSGRKFPFPFFVTCFQMAVALFWLYALTLLQRHGPRSLNVLLNLEDIPKLEWKVKNVLSAAGVAAAFTAMLASGNLCLMFVQAAKSQHILCILLLSYFLRKEVQPWPVVVSCIGVTVGFVINAVAEADIVITKLGEDLTTLIYGCLAGFVSSFFVALYPMLLHSSILKGKNNCFPRQISINVNAMSLAWYMPLILYEILVGGLLSSPFLLDIEFWLFNFATASVGFVLNVAAMLQVKFTSPLTHMVVGSVKGAVTSVIGVLFYGNRMDGMSCIGLSVLLISSFAYSYLKQAAHKKLK
eukprot:767730-Hanusia_phi.AAC.2